MLARHDCRGLTNAGTNPPVGSASVALPSPDIVGRTTSTGLTRADLSIQLVERVPDLVQHLTSAGGQAVDAGAGRPFGFDSAKPSTLRHPCEHRIQRARTQPVPVTVQFFEHPLAVDAVFVGVMQDVDLPEREQKLPNHRIAHGQVILAPTPS